MDNKVLSLIPIIRDGKKVGDKTLNSKLLKLAKPHCDTVKFLQGTTQVISDDKACNKIACNNKYGLDNQAIKPDTDANILDSIVYSALYDNLQNNADVYEAHQALNEGEDGLRRWSPELRLAAYSAFLSSLIELNKKAASIAEALIPRYRDLMQEYGETLAKNKKE